MKHKKLNIFIFSFIILVGLCIGVFADNDFSLSGYYSYSSPYNLGELKYSVSDTPVSISAGDYYIHLHVNQLPDSNIHLVDLYNNEIIWMSDTNTIVANHYSSTTDIVTYYYQIDGNSDIYIFTNEPSDLPGVHYSSANANGVYISCQYYSISEFSTIDVYSNSQDVWSNVVSSVSTATNTVLDNDILLLFAAALPIISFGAGMLIRLFRKS